MYHLSSGKEIAAVVASDALGHHADFDAVAELERLDLARNDRERITFTDAGQRTRGPYGHPEDWRRPDGSPRTGTGAKYALLEWPAESHGSEHKIASDTFLAAMEGAAPEASWLAFMKAAIAADIFVE